MARVARAFVALVRLVCGFLALALVAHIVLSIFDANPDNVITRTVADIADAAALPFADLFTPADETLRLLVTYGLAALCWLLVAGIVTGVARRATSTYEIRG